MTYLSHSDSHIVVLSSPEQLNTALFIFQPTPSQQKTLFSFFFFFWVPLQVYSMFALFTKAAEPEVFYLCQFLLSISSNTYLKLSTRVLSHCCCAVKGKQGNRA